MSFFSELNRRNVTRVAIAYAVASWLLTEVASVVLPTFSAPEWVLQVLIALLAMGFPLALVISWVYELTPEGLKRESRIEPGQSIAQQTARKLNVVVIVLLAVAIGLFTWDRFVRAPTLIQNATETAGQTAGNENAPGEESHPSVAVLAFENMSPDTDNQYFADGISEEILNLLADVATLSVASRTSAFALKGKDLSIPEIASALNVRYVLEGSVRKAGNQVRVTAQLIEAETDRHLWSEAYDRTLEDIFTIQDEIAAAIGSALQVRLLGTGGDEVRSQPIDPEVYTLFLDARYRLRRRSAEDIRAANEMLIRVVGAEPGFARAHAVLGEAYFLNFQLPLLDEDLVQAMARMHAAIARSLDPRLSGVDLILGKLAEEDHDLVAALNHFKQAIALEPDEPRPYHWRGGLYASMGLSQKCRADLETALRLDPENPNVHFALGGCLLGSGALDRARSLSERGATLGNTGGYSQLILVELLKGNVDGAIRAITRHIDEHGADPESWADGLTVLQSGAWPAQEAESILTPRPETAPPLILALWPNRYLDYVEQNSRLSGFSLRFFAPLWGEYAIQLRRQPQFIDLMEATGAFDVWQAEGPPADCRSEGERYSCGHGATAD